MLNINKNTTLSYPLSCTVLFAIALGSCERSDGWQRQLPNSHILLYIEGDDAHNIYTEYSFRRGGGRTLPPRGEVRQRMRVAIVQDRFVVASGDAGEGTVPERWYLLDTLKYECLDFRRSEDLDAAMQERGLGSLREIRLIDPKRLQSKIHIYPGSLPTAPKTP